jgi:hypothetical protein
MWRALTCSVADLLRRCCVHLERYLGFHLVDFSCGPNIWVSFRLLGFSSLLLFNGLTPLHCSKLHTSSISPNVPSGSFVSLLELTDSVCSLYDTSVVSSCSEDAYFRRLRTTCLLFRILTLYSLIGLMMQTASGVSHLLRRPVHLLHNTGHCAQSVRRVCLS